MPVFYVRLAARNLGKSLRREIAARRCLKSGRPEPAAKAGGDKKNLRDEAAEA
jgi:hypothetical protein